MEVFKLTCLDSEVVEQWPKVPETATPIANPNFFGDPCEPETLDPRQMHRLKQPHFHLTFSGEAVIQVGKQHEVMMFGKYKGQKVADVPDHYLHWMIRKSLSDAVDLYIELRRRKVSKAFETGENTLVDTLTF